LEHEGLREELTQAIEAALKQPDAKDVAKRRKVLAFAIDRVLGDYQPPLLTINQAGRAIRKAGICFQNPERTLRDWAHNRKGEIQPVPKAGWNDCRQQRRYRAVFKAAPGWVQR